MIASNNQRKLFIPEEPTVGVGVEKPYALSFVAGRVDCLQYMTDQGALRLLRQEMVHLEKLLEERPCGACLV